jgi:hypothetical protein
VVNELRCGLGEKLRSLRSLKVRLLEAGASWFGTVQWGELKRPATPVALKVSGIRVVLWCEAGCGKVASA